MGFDHIDKGSQEYHSLSLGAYFRHTRKLIFFSFLDTEIIDMGSSCVRIHANYNRHIDCYTGIPEAHLGIHNLKLYTSIKSDGGNRQSENSKEA